MHMSSDLFIRLEDLLRNLKIAKTYDGYPLLITAVDLALEDENRLLNLTKHLYPTVAQQHHTSSDCVQKNLRTVIEACWRNNGQEQIERIFHLHFDKKPSAGIFIDLLTGYLKKLQ